MERFLRLLICIALGPLAYFLTLDHMPWPASATAGLSVSIIAMWMTEALPLAVTGFLVPCLAALFGMTTLEKAFASFGHPLIYLFMGGFVIARGMAVSGLDRRVALTILTTRGIQGRPWPTILALLLITGFFSMWISNTATIAMMLPIATGILNAIFPNDRKTHSLCLISLAYASSIGGMATPIGSTPNILSIGLMRERMPEFSISFFDWMLISAPLSLLILGFMLFLLRRSLKKIPRQFEDQTLREESESLGPMSRSEKNSLASILLAASIWIVPSILQLLSQTLPLLKPFAYELSRRLPEASGALFGASLLFVLPKCDGKPTLSWSEASQIDWGSLLLFGGGLSLGTLIFSSGLGNLIGAQFVNFAGDMSLFFFLLSLVSVTIMITETTSNTATASLFIPLILATTINSELPTLAPVLGTAWACSLAFMLPVATPPNAIVYGTGNIKLTEMIRFGSYMNLASILIITGYLYWLQKLNLLKF